MFHLLVPDCERQRSPFRLIIQRRISKLCHLDELHIPIAGSFQHEIRQAFTIGACRHALYFATSRLPAGNDELVFERLALKRTQNCQSLSDLQSIWVLLRDYLDRITKWRFVVIRQLVTNLKNRPHMFRIPLTNILSELFIPGDALPVCQECRRAPGSR